MFKRVVWNDKLLKGLNGGGYFCSQCGGEMEFENEWRDVLVCNNCGWSIDLDDYGTENDAWPPPYHPQ